MNSKLIYGVGVNDAEHDVTRYEKVFINGVEKTIQTWICPFYATWRGVMQRCYDERFREKHPTYKNATCCKEWNVFSNFKLWMESKDYVGKFLDKDILLENNKHYSPETCIFVSRRLNNFLLDSGASRKGKLVGVSFKKSNQKFVAQLSNPITGKQQHLGYYDDEHSAYIAWKSKKAELLTMLLEEENVDDCVRKALLKRFL